MQFLKVSECRRFLELEGGGAFFWMGDTAWELFHRLTREEAELYLDTRQAQGFNVVQAVALAEHDGLNVPNAYGRVPLKRDADGSYRSCTPDLEGPYSYWAFVDDVIAMAEARGIYVALLPTWGDKWNLMWGKGPEIFDAENAASFARFIGERYGDRANVIWVLQGDRPVTEARHFDVLHAMGSTLRACVDRRQLITAHPPGQASSSATFHEASWLDLNMIQSSHGARHFANDAMVAADRALLPVKPTLDAEPRYEDHPVGFDPKLGYFDAADVREALYRAVLAGGCGVTYGHHSVWAMQTECTAYWPLTWRAALRRPGAEQVRHLVSLMRQVPWQQGEPHEEWLHAVYEGANRSPVWAGEGFLLAYAPNGLSLVFERADWGYLMEGRWMDPRTGAWHDAVAEVNRDGVSFAPLSSGRGEDWILVVGG